MAETKTSATAASVDAYLDAIADEQRRADCRALVAMLRKITGEAPVMWSTSIIGFGRYTYLYDSGHSGESCLIGFASRKSEIVLYLMSGLDPADPLLTQLGKHRRGKGCLYMRRLADIDIDALRALLAQAFAKTRTKAKKQ